MVDTIFVFAMTLLVLGIVMPKLAVNLAAAELLVYREQLLPQFVLFIIAFLVLAHFWIEHHHKFHLLRIVDPGILRFNFAILIFIVLIPFTTDVSGAYDGVLIAFLFLYVNILIIGALFLGQWLHICRCDHLCEAEFALATERERFRLLAIVPSVAILGIGAAFFSPPYSLSIYLIVPVIINVRGNPPDIRIKKTGE
jgi:uncharacterized membrane protein